MSADIDIDVPDRTAVLKLIQAFTSQTFLKTYPTAVQP